jgi:hypothetical protein
MEAAMTDCRWRVALVIVLAVVLSPLQEAQAQTEDAYAQFNKAVELAKAGSHEEAVGICLTVLDRLPETDRPRVHKLLGFSYKSLGRMPESWHHLSRYVATMAKEDTKTEGWLEKVETELGQEHVKVVLSCTPEGASLTLPPEASSARTPYLCPLTWWFKPGKHAIAAAMDGYQSATVEIEVRQRGDKGVHAIALVPLGKPDKGGAVAAVVTKPAASKKQRVAGAALLGSGVVLGIVGAVLHGVAHSTNEDLHDKYLPSNEAQYHDDYASDVKPKMVAAYVLYGTGAAALTAGIVMLAVKPKKAKALSLQVSPMPLPAGSGASLSLQF